GVVGHDQGQAQVHQGCDHRQCDAGVAAGGFDQAVAGSYLAAFERPEDHGEGGAVLHASARVLALEFGEEAHPSVWRQAAQLHQRRVADQVQDVHVASGSEPSSRTSPVAMEARYDTLLYGGTERVSHTFPPMTLSCPTTVLPPRMVAPA